MRTITTHNMPATGLRGIGDTSWQPHGVCHGMDPEDADVTFFPLPRDHEAIAEAKELCAACPVKRECLNFALENVLKEGIWGGLTEAERRPWHDGLPQRLDYSRVIAFFNGRDVHLTAKEQKVVVDHAYARGWRADRLAVALQISHNHARDLLTQAAHKVFHRDLTLGVPPRKKKRKQSKPATSKPATGQVAQEQPVSRPVKSTSAHAPLGKAAA
ncbi:WhiB family transcriptional regulator [Streptomyces ipomoeae]|uniref:WhiB family transcriptional regulator n=1 Tax=Streptomyces ipomoeae TaxID=103232 RepID=UPI0029BA374C|nr:WhiB family transcriptional regulator [Streptomyces ipomoeae]MDX2819922.1 WhiB family transcriptional regulator [Streptomyces ipomoeae]MDX2872632.1 WhiB family transcriptional regulator [Streptomyces ipomoeae]